MSLSDILTGTSWKLSTWCLNGGAASRSPNRGTNENCAQSRFNYCSVLVSVCLPASDSPSEYSLCVLSVMKQSLQDTEQTRGRIKPVRELSATASGEWAARENLRRLQRHGRHRKRPRPCGRGPGAPLQGKGDDFAPQHSNYNCSVSVSVSTAIHKVPRIHGDCCYLGVQPRRRATCFTLPLLFLLGTCHCYESQSRAAGGSSDLPQPGSSPFFCSRAPSQW